MGGDSVSAASLLDVLPRPLPLSLGGGTYLVGEFTLDDLADLQAWLVARWEDPMGGLRDRLDGMGEDERRESLRGAIAAAEEGPPTWGDDRRRALLATGAGILEVFRVALRRHHPGLAGEALVAVAERTTPEEYSALQRRLYGVTPLDEAEAALGMPRGGGGGEPIPWSQAVCEVAELYPGWTFEHIGSLTLSQVRAARRGGKPEVRGVPLAPEMDRESLRRMVREARKRFHGPEKGAG